MHPVERICAGKPGRGLRAVEAVVVHCVPFPFGALGGVVPPREHHRLGLALALLVEFASTPGRLLPLRLGAKLLARPCAVGLGLRPRHAVHRVFYLARDQVGGRDAIAIRAADERTGPFVRDAGLVLVHRDLGHVDLVGIQVHFVDWMLIGSTVGIVDL